MRIASFSSTHGLPACPFRSFDDLPLLRPRDLKRPEPQFAIARYRITRLRICDQPAHRPRNVLPRVFVKRTQMLADFGQALHFSPGLKCVKVLDRYTCDEIDPSDNRAGL
jgi:hypothetical protein